ncbi:MAG: acetyl-CoA carboxylase biotin carboxyl carrier protein [Phycisphaerales bacterium]|nr:acetyl-CoA carboxylase biotin carboxyl carrier protein [Phycisphaerales bacterium]
MREPVGAQWRKPQVVDPEKIRSLVEIMTEHDLCEFSWRSGEEEIVLKRPGPPAVGAAPVMYSAPAAPAPAAAAAPVETAAPAAPAVDENAGLVAIKSPMVGTIYIAPDPESPPFVTEGGRVSPTSVVCIVEAMKVFNEIKAEISGTVKKVLVKNEDPVEFGQPLFMVKPD